MFAPARGASSGASAPCASLGNVGCALRTYPGQYLNLYVGKEFDVGGGGSVDLPDSSRPTATTQVLGEMHLVTPAEAPFTFAQADSLKTPWELLVGVRAQRSASTGARSCGRPRHRHRRPATAARRSA